MKAPLRKNVSMTEVFEGKQRILWAAQRPIYERCEVILLVAKASSMGTLGIEPYEMIGPRTNSGKDVRQLCS